MAHTAPPSSGHRHQQCEIGTEFGLRPTSRLITFSLRPTDSFINNGSTEQIIHEHNIRERSLICATAHFTAAVNAQKSPNGGNRQGNTAFSIIIALNSDEGTLSRSMQ